jgi:hypothetical protein
MAEDRAKRSVPFYYQVASILLLLILVGFTLSGLWGVVRMVAPGVTESDYEYKQTSDFDTFAQRNLARVGDRFVARGSTIVAEGDTLTREQVEAKRSAARDRLLADERREGLKQIIFWVIAVGICLPLYVYHHRVVQRFRARAEEPA